MPDFDIRKANGFKSTFVELIFIAVSFFLAQRWNGYITEVINAIFPEGSGIIVKGILNILITLFMVGGVIFINRKLNRTTEYKQQKRH